MTMTTTTWTQQPLTDLARLAAGLTSGGRKSANPPEWHQK